MPVRRRCRTQNQYYFCVEGETEKWYLDHLERLINEQDELTPVSFQVFISKDPIQCIKRKSWDGQVFFLCDIESESPASMRIFQDTLEKLAKASTMRPKTTFQLAYSHCSFELWLMLHKTASAPRVTSASQYHRHLNRAFECNFQRWDDHKTEKEFKRMIRGITLVDVVQAVSRAEGIHAGSASAGDILCEHAGYRYNSNNPALSVDEVVKRILREAGYPHM